LECLGKGCFARETPSLRDRPSVEVVEQRLGPGLPLSPPVCCRVATDVILDGVEVLNAPQGFRGDWGLSGVEDLEEFSAGVG
jgi:hypothetical protein